MSERLAGPMDVRDVVVAVQAAMSEGRLMDAATLVAAMPVSADEFAAGFALLAPEPARATDAVDGLGLAVLREYAVAPAEVQALWRRRACAGRDDEVPMSAAERQAWSRFQRKLALALMPELGDVT